MTKEGCGLLKQSIPKQSETQPISPVILSKRGGWGYQHTIGKLNPFPTPVAGRAMGSVGH